MAVLLGLIFAFLVSELIVRLFFPMPEEMTWLIPDGRYGHVLKPDFRGDYRFPRSNLTMRVEINSMGLRDTEINSALLADTTVTKILLLGDSFVFAHGLNREDGFDSALERLFTAAGRRTLVINAGISGWGTAQSLLYARDSFARLQPDIVVYTFCGNDPTDDVRFLSGRFDTQKGSFYFSGKIFLRKKSQFFRFLLVKFQVLSHRIRMLKKARGENSVKHDAQSGVFISQQDWRRTSKLIKTFQQDFLAFNPEGLLLILATDPQNPDIQTHLLSLDDGNTLFYIDLNPAVRDIPEAERTLPYDGHWSRLMHQLAAENVFDFLKEREKR